MIMGHVGWRVNLTDKYKEIGVKETMKTMKKIVSIGICVAMLSGAALAEETAGLGNNPAGIGWNEQMNQQG